MKCTILLAIFPGISPYNLCPNQRTFNTRHASYRNMQQQMSLNCCNFMSRWKNIYSVSAQKRGNKNPLCHPRHYFSAALSLLYLKLHKKEENGGHKVVGIDTHLCECAGVRAFCVTPNHTHSLCTQTCQ